MSFLFLLFLCKIEKKIFLFFIPVSKIKFQLKVIWWLLILGLQISIIGYNTFPNWLSKMILDHTKKDTFFLVEKEISCQGFAVALTHWQGCVCVCIHIIGCTLDEHIPESFGLIWWGLSDTDKSSKNSIQIWNGFSQRITNGKIIFVWFFLLEEEEENYKKSVFYFLTGEKFYFILFFKHLKDVWKIITVIQEEGKKMVICGIQNLFFPPWEKVKMLAFVSSAISFRMMPFFSSKSQNYLL